MQVADSRIGEHSRRSGEQVAGQCSRGAVPQVNWRVGEIVASRAIRSCREAKFDRIKLVAIEQKAVVIDVSPGRIPRDNHAIGAGLAAGAHQAGIQNNEIVPDNAPSMVEIRRRVIQAISHRPVHIEENILLGERIGRMSPEQHRRIPEVSRCIRIVEVLKQVAANDPVLRRVGANPVEIADPRAVVARRAAGVFEPAILDDPIVDADAGVHVRGIGFDKLRAGIEQSDAIDARRLGARVKNDFVVVSIADR